MAIRELEERHISQVIRLWQELERRFQEVSAPQASLLVWHANVPAISLYERLGYELVEGVRYMGKRFSSADANGATSHRPHT